MINPNKLLTDFKTVEEDLQELMKHEKNFEYHRFFDMIYQNIAVQRCKAEYFFDNADEYKRQMEKEDKKSNKGNHRAD